MFFNNNIFILANLIKVQLEEICFVVVVVEIFRLESFDFFVC